MNNIPTAKQYLKDKGLSEVISESDLIEFAKLHCEAQLKTILEKARVREDELNPLNTDEIKDSFISVEFEADKGYEEYCPYRYTVDKNSIINAYPLDLIK